MKGKVKKIISSSGFSLTYLFISFMVFMNCGVYSLNTFMQIDVSKGVLAFLDMFIQTDASKGLLILIVGFMQFRIMLKLFYYQLEK